MPPSHRCPSLSGQRTQIWPHSRPGTLLVQTRQQWAAVGQGAAPRAQPSSGQSPLPNQTRRQQEQTPAPGMEFFPFSYKFGKPRGNCSDAGSVVIFWKATGGDAKPAGTHWERGLGRVSFREGKGMSRGDAACFPAVAFRMGQVSTILLDNCHVHNGKCT